MIILDHYLQPGHCLCSDGIALVALVILIIVIFVLIHSNNYHDYHHYRDPNVQGIAYAVVAGLEPQYGLYSAFMGCFAYCIFGR